MMEDEFLDRTFRVVTLMYIDWIHYIVPTFQRFLDENMPTYI